MVSGRPGWTRMKAADSLHRRFRSPGSHHGVPGKDRTSMRMWRRDMVRNIARGRHRCGLQRLGCGLLLVAGSVLAGCSSQPTARQVEAAQHPAIQSFAGAPSGGGSGDSSSSPQMKTNLPSAPVNTPLCGTALREQASTGSEIYGRSLATGNSCTRNACFQPLTGTFIAEDGNNSVCR